MGNQYEWILEKPLPTVIEETRGFWDGTKKHELRVQVCADCGHKQFPGSPCCAECLSPHVGWKKTTGKGTVFSYTVVHHAFHPAFADDVPYIVVDVQLDEGPIVTSNLEGVEPEKVRIGMPVRVRFHKVNDEITLPKFRVDLQRA